MDPGSQAPDLSGASRRDALLRQVAAAVGRGQMAEAAQLAEQALAGGFEHPRLLNLVAYQCIRRSDFERARTLLERARQIAPNDVHVLNGLGVAYKRLGRLTEATAALDAALAIDPMHFDAQFNQGTVLEAEGAVDAAKLAYERAVELKPDNAEALSRLSFLAAMRGDYDEALSHGERALKGRADSAPLKLAEFAVRRGDYEAALKLARKAREQERPDPWAAVVQAQAELGLGDDAGARQHVQSVLQDALAPNIRAFALSVLADVDDREGDTASAFSNYVAAKEESRRHHAKDFAAPGMTSYLTLVERTLAYFRDVPADAWNTPADAVPAPSDGHVFLLGFPRSGTTLLQQALAARPDVATTEEMNPFPDAIRDFFLTPGGWSRLEALDDVALDPYRETYWRTCRAAAPTLDGKMFVDKNPLRTVFLPIVARMFPDAKILFAVRDPREVVFSCLRQQFRMSLPMYEFCTLEGCARLYDAVMRLAGVYRKKLALDLMEIRHEDVVANFEDAMRTTCTFLDLAWDERMHDVAAPGRTQLIKTPSASQVSRGVYESGGRWRRYRDELAPMMPILMPWVERFGYPDA